MRTCHPSKRFDVRHPCARQEALVQAATFFAPARVAAFKSVPAFLGCCLENPQEFGAATVLVQCDAAGPSLLHCPPPSAHPHAVPVSEPVPVAACSFQASHGGTRALLRRLLSCRTATLLCSLTGGQQAAAVLAAAARTRRSSLRCGQTWLATSRTIRRTSCGLSWDFTLLL